VVNATFQPHRLNLALSGMRLRGGGRRWVMTGKTVEAANTIASPSGVTIIESKVAGTGAVTVPPISAAIYEMPIAAR